MKFGLKEELIEQIVNIISKFETIEKAVVFGSRARGDFRYNSDIDIAIYTSNDEDMRGKMLSELDEINTLYKFDVIQVNKVTNEKLVEFILNEGIEIYTSSHIK